MAPPVRCYCKVTKCNGILVPPHVFRSHERSDLCQQTLADQANFARRVGQCIISQGDADIEPVPRGFSVPLHEPPPPLSPEFRDPLADVVLDYGALTDVDFGIATSSGPLPNLGPNMRSPEALIAAVDHFDAYNNATAGEDHTDLLHLPHHLLVIYALVSWLHLQFHLPRVTCNALLAILACILLSIAPAINTPFITLQSSNRVLGVDKTIYTLPVCPSCRKVFPPAGSVHTVDTCPICLDDLFLSEHTLRGNQRAVKSPKHYWMARLEVFALVLQMQQFAGTGSSTLWTRVLHVSSLVLEKQATALVWGCGLHLVPRTASENVAHCLMRKECASFHDQDREGVRCSLCLGMNGVSANNMIGQPWSTEDEAGQIGVDHSFETGGLD
ncbi:hypothetical protein DFJ58DRAFT_885236 [Suillus subalutaceus]|uniref:uncharacterized protein n=1 Tax=Suillus subalutaceus TaxID=48586 RepID=UPI001B861B2E|nr:uncharacterized protein DFJ58DRAFT_885236 [Suillus subalutaceus]KAG1852439.1 hypothetical protein DFJ58DRAFT_885236 [Suillus subalutaceus]